MCGGCFKNSTKTPPPPPPVFLIGCPMQGKYHLSSNSLLKKPTYYFLNNCIHKKRERLTDQLFYFSDRGVKTWQMSGVEAKTISYYQILGVQFFFSFCFPCFAESTSPIHTKYKIRHMKKKKNWSVIPYNTALVKKPQKDTTSCITLFYE